MVSVHSCRWLLWEGLGSLLPWPLTALCPQSGPLSLPISFTCCDCLERRRGSISPTLIFSKQEAVSWIGLHWVAMTMISDLVILRGREYVYAHTLCKCIYTNKPCVALKFLTYSNISCTRTLYHRHASILWALLTLSVTVYRLKCLIMLLFILLFLVLVNSLETQ